MDYYFHTGVCLESTWGYDTSKFADEPPPEAVAQRAQHKALFHYGCPDLDTLKHSLAQGFPVQFGFEVYRSMMNASKGDVPYPVGDTQIGGHAVLAVGYDDNYKIGFEKGAVKFQNSWGDAWGVRGFGYLPYRYFVEDMASDFRTLRKETP
jgi:C1A family cysteine protease